MIELPQMREWLTAAEAAAEELPGAPYSERQFRNLMAGGTIPSRPRQGRGGGREFHWSDLPRQARDEYLKRYGRRAEAVSAKAGDPAIRAASRDLKAEARRLIADAAAQFRNSAALPAGKSLDLFAALYAKRRAPGVEPWVYEIERAAQPHQVRAWDRTIRLHGTGALVDSRGRPKGTSAIARDDQLRAYVVAAIAARPQLSCVHLRAAIATDLNRDIALRTLQDFVGRLRAENAPTLKALTDPDRHRSHHQPAFGSRSMAPVRINQLWEIDATRADAMCLLADGSRRRFALTALIDVFTRRALVLVSDQPKALATQALLRRAILTWGVPETLKADNGKEYRNRAVERFCASVGIAIHWSRPFTPEEKPHIERFFGTLNRGLFPLLPGFVGHNVAERQAIEHRASFAHRFGEEAELVIETQLSPIDLQARIDRWIAIYQDTPHEGISGERPAMRALAHREAAKFIGSERALDQLLLPAPDSSGIRVVLKRGVRVGNAWFIAPELGALMGSRVFVRHDPHDLSRIVVYSHDGDTFVCVAKNADGLDGQERAAIARAAQSEARGRIRDIRNDVRKVQTLYPALGLGDRILNSPHPEEAAQRPSRRSEFPLDDEARRALIAASPLKLIAAGDGQAALEADASAPEPIALPAPAPAAGTVQCDGYERPHFETDAQFAEWARAFQTAGGRLDATDNAYLKEISESSALHLAYGNGSRR